MNIEKLRAAKRENTTTAFPMHHSKDAVDSAVRAASHLASTEQRIRRYQRMIREDMLSPKGLNEIHSQLILLQEVRTNLLSEMRMLLGLFSNQIHAKFKVESGTITGTAGAKVKDVEYEDDGSITVVIDHWPQSPVKRDALYGQIGQALSDQLQAMVANLDGESPDWSDAREVDHVVDAVMKRLDEKFPGLVEAE